MKKPTPSKAERALDRALVDRKRAADAVAKSERAVNTSKAMRQHESNKRSLARAEANLQKARERLAPPSASAEEGEPS